MSVFQRNKESFLFMAVTLLIAGLAVLVLYRKAPGAAADTPVVQGITAFDAAAHSTRILKDSFVVLLKSAYATALIQEQKDQLQLTITAAAKKASDFYNDNPDLLQVKSADFSMTHDKRKDEIQAMFRIYKEGNILFVRVPNDILFQLTENTWNTQHG